MENVLSSDLDTDKREKIKIIIADEYPLIRRGIRTILEEQQDLEVIAEVGTTAEALETVSILRPDLVILDETLPGGDTYALTKKILEIAPNTKILALTDYSNVGHLKSIMDAGASDYLTKKALCDEVTFFVRSIIVGLNPFTKTNYRETVKLGVGKTEPLILTNSNEFSDRELNILRLIYNGKSNKEIASIERVNLSYIKATISNIFIKLGSSSRTEAISIALKNGILSLKDLNE